MGEKLNRRWQGTAGARAAAGLILLVLTAHAFVASATHFHRPRHVVAGSTQAALLGREEGGQSAPLAGDAQCLLCRLQRDFVSGVRHAVPAVAPLPVEALNYEPLPNTAVHAACSLLRPGRAPPQA